MVKGKRPKRENTLRLPRPGACRISLSAFSDCISGAATVRLTFSSRPPPLSRIIRCVIVFKKYYFALLAFFIIAGAVYYQVFDAIRREANVPFGGRTEFRALIKKASQSSANQEIIAELISHYSGKIRINAARYPSFEYGDLVEVIGAIQKPPEKSADYFLKEGIAGIINL